MEVKNPLSTSTEEMLLVTNLRYRCPACDKLEHTATYPHNHSHDLPLAIQVGRNHNPTSGSTLTE